MCWDILCFLCTRNYKCLDRGDTNSLRNIKVESSEDKSRYVATPKQSRKTVGSVVVARYDYSNSEANCIKVSKNKRFTIVEDDNPEWTLVMDNDTKTMGYAPKDLFVKESSPCSEEWYFENVSRIEVERTLLLPSHEIGMFLIRKSRNMERYPFVISVRYDNPKQKTHIKHFKIFQNSKNNYYYISEGLEFPSLGELVRVYKENCLLGTCLTKPCESPKPTIGALSPFHKGWEIPKEEIHISRDRKLGGGNFSTVFYGTWKFNTEVAVKMLNDDCDIKQIQKEIKIMKTLRHRNLVKLYGVCTMNMPYWIIEEYMPNGSILSFIEKFDLINEHSIFIAYQVADGMAYLESKNIVHRDLAARNILIGETGLVKISDFGLSRVMDNGAYMSNHETKLPIRWMAPEVFSNNLYTTKGDVWSFGIFLVELHTNGTKPYASFNNFEVVAKVLKGYRLGKPKKMPDNIFKITSRCWEADQKKRPLFSELKKEFEKMMAEWEQTEEYIT